jgi:hypothetical protein
MPQIGERRSGATETVEWDGQRWQPVEGGAAPQQEGALSRFLGGALSTSPLNPMNLVRAAAHPVDTLGHLIGDPLNNLFKAGGDVKAAITGERGDRLSSALQAVEHLGGAVPLIGPAGIQAGEKIGNGDMAGGAGELAGLTSGALVPDVASGLANNIPGAMVRGGEAMARGGAKLKGAGGVSVGGIHVPLTTMGSGGSRNARRPQRARGGRGSLRNGVWREGRRGDWSRARGVARTAGTEGRTRRVGPGGTVETRGITGGPASGATEGEQCPIGGHWRRPLQDGGTRTHRQRHRRRHRFL